MLWGMALIAASSSVVPHTLSARSRTLLAASSFSFRVLRASVEFAQPRPEAGPQRAGSQRIFRAPSVRSLPPPHTPSREVATSSSALTIRDRLAGRPPRPG